MSNEAGVPRVYENGDLPKQKVMGIIGEVKIPEIPEEINLLEFNFPVAQQLAPNNIKIYQVITFGEKARIMIERFRKGELSSGQEVVVGGRVRIEEQKTRRPGQVNVIRQIFPIAVLPVPQRPNSPK